MGSFTRLSRWGVSLALAAAAFPAAAQFSDSYTFLNAVKDADGDKALPFLNKPGAPVLNAHATGTGEGALHYVVKRHDHTWLAFLLGRGADPNIRDDDDVTPLMIATQLSDPDAMRTLIQAGANVNITNKRGETPLIMAVQKRDLVAVNILLAQGANPDIADTIAGKSARDYAQEDPRGAPIVRTLDEAKSKKPAKISGPVLPK